MALEEMGCPQLPTTIEMGNSAAASVAKNSTKQKQPKATDR
jgi:hypothetical protein